MKCISFASLPDLFNDPSPYVPFTTEGYTMFGSRIDAMKLVEKLTGVTDHAENRQALLKLPDAWFHESVKGGVRVCEVNLPNARKVVEQVEHTVTKEFRKEFNRIIDTVVYGSSEFIASVDVDFVDFRAEGPILGEVADDNFDVVELAGTAVRIVKEGDNKGLIDAKSLVKAMTAQDSTKARQMITELYNSEIFPLKNFVQDNSFRVPGGWPTLLLHPVDATSFVMLVSPEKINHNLRKLFADDIREKLFAVRSPSDDPPPADDGSAAGGSAAGGSAADVYRSAAGGSAAGGSAADVYRSAAGGSSADDYRSAAGGSSADDYRSAGKGAARWASSAAMDEVEEDNGGGSGAAGAEAFDNGSGAADTGSGSAGISARVELRETGPSLIFSAREYVAGASADLAQKFGPALDQAVREQGKSVGGFVNAFKWNAAAKSTTKVVEDSHGAAAEDDSGNTRPLKQQKKLSEEERQQREKRFKYTSSIFTRIQDLSKPERKLSEEDIQLLSSKYVAITEDTERLSEQDLDDILGLIDHVAESICKLSAMRARLDAAHFETLRKGFVSCLP